VQFDALLTAEQLTFDALVVCPLIAVLMLYYSSPYAVLVCKLCNPSNILTFFRCNYLTFIFVTLVSSNCTFIDFEMVRDDMITVYHGHDAKMQKCAIIFLIEAKFLINFILKLNIIGVI